jgi:hypothetical protein
MTFDDFQSKLIALETLAEGRILLNLDQREIVLRQEPRKIIEQIEATLHLASIESTMLDTSDLKALQIAPANLSLAAPRAKKLLKAQN